MIVIRIELWPGGDNSRARNLGVATISNVGPPQSKTRGAYEIKLYKAGQQLTAYTQGRIYNFKRKQYGAWYLLAGALTTLLSWKDAFDGEPTAEKPVIVSSSRNRKHLEDELRPGITLRDPSPT